jgi:hypothetical protein
MFQKFDISKFPEVKAKCIKLLEEGLSEEEVADRMLNGLILGADDASDLIVRELKRTTADMLANRRQIREGFQARLYRLWGRGFNALRALLEAASESGAEFHRYYSPLARKDDFVFEAVVRLHARACLTMSEILWLMEGGYASGALARWRALHELAVVAFFIVDNGPSVAESYLLHAHIETYKEALMYQRHCKRLGEVRLRKREVERVERHRNSLCDRFGRSYKGDWGWAAEAIGIENPTFAQIEERVDLSHFRPYFKLGSHFTHAGSKGLYANPGAMRVAGEPEILLSGPSNAGLYQPGVQGDCAILGNLA